MKYSFLFVCCLFLPSVLYGMEMDPEAAEEGRASPNFERNQRLEEILQQINEGGDPATLPLNKQKKQALACLMEKAGTGQETTVVLGFLLRESRDELAQSEQRIEKTRFISFAGGSTLTFLTVTAVYVMQSYFCCWY